VFKDVWCGFSAAEMAVFATVLVVNNYHFPRCWLCFAAAPLSVTIFPLFGFFCRHPFLVTLP